MTLAVPEDSPAPEAVRYAFTWLPLPDWNLYPNLEVVFSVSAGVDQFHDLPDHVRLIRMVDSRNNQRVGEYVLAACLACLRDFPRYAHNQIGKTWAPAPGRFIADTTVGLLGFGEIGQLAATRLANTGFPVAAWSRSRKPDAPIPQHTGPDGLEALLASSDIVVCLLPLTSETRGLLNADFFRRMKPGSSLVHVGRGAHCDLKALGSALSNGHLSQAIVDVFEDEPLTPSNPAWDQPNLSVTPHVAGRIDPETAVANILDNLQRHRDGLPLLWQVDRALGY